MQRFFLFIVSIMAATTGFCQTNFSYSIVSPKGQASARMNGVGVQLPAVKKNVPFTVNIAIDKGFKIYINQDGETIPYSPDFIKTLGSLTSADNTLESLWFAKNFESLGALSAKFDRLYSMRSDMEGDALEYVNTLHKYGCIVDDPLIESYIYRLINKLLPQFQRADFYSNGIKVFIVNDDSLNASMFPNGFVLINTGLLANLHSEDELLAVLAHEIAHFVGNHALVNIIKAQQRADRAVFWASIAGLAVGTLEAYTITQGVNTGGELTYSAGILAGVLANEINVRMGLDFSKEQEKDADLTALEALRIIGCDENALASAFQRMVDYSNEDGDWSAIYRSGDHPSLKDRISYSGRPVNKVEKDYERIVSFPVTDAASIKFGEGKYLIALRLVNQNINNGVATDEDYLLSSLCKIALNANHKYDGEIVGDIELAKQINPNSMRILKAEIMAQLHVGNHDLALLLLKNYYSRVDDTLKTYSAGDKRRERMLEEKEWSRRQIIKISGYAQK